jgi:transcriptional regulator with XRE-family HTH domain
MTVIELPSGLMPTTTTTSALDQFGEAIRVRRKRLGWSQETLGGHVAAVLGLERVPQSTVAAWESGTNNPSPETAFAIEHALMARPGELTRVLGFVPATVGRAPAGVEQAIMADSLLSPTMKRALVAAYRELAD